MKPWTRTLLLWLMALILPLQGLAASLMPLCAHAEHRRGAWAAGESQAVMPVHSVAAAHAASPQPDMAPCHGEVADSKAPLHADCGCSACAACGALLALPAQVMLPADPGTVDAFAVAVPAPVRSHHPDGLDRPPRRLFA